MTAEGDPIRPLRRPSPSARPIPAVPRRPAAGLVVVPVVPAGRPGLDLSGLWSAMSAEPPHAPGPAAAGGPGQDGPGGADPELARVQALVRLAQQGDTDAFGRLYTQYVDVVYRYVYVRVGSVHLAQDITSETFIKAMRGIGAFTWQGKDIAAWFVTIARNLVNDHVKSSRFRMEVATADMLDADQAVDAPDGQVLDRIRDERLLEAVRALKPEQAECIVLRFMDGLSLAETSMVLGKKENAVKQLQLRAVRALQRSLEGEEL